MQAHISTPGDYSQWYQVECMETETPRHSNVTGYGPKIPTRYMLRIKGRWRRVYAACFGNAATLYIGQPGARQYLVQSIDGRAT